jgi:tetratricopeptide (TPR) repeat protein
LKKLFTYHFIFYSGFIISQSAADSLSTALKNYKSACSKPCLADTGKLILLSRLSEECDLTEILGYASPAVELADAIINLSSDQSIKNSILNQKAMALSNIGFFYNNTGSWTKAINYHEQSLKIQQALLLSAKGREQQFELKKAVANSLNNLGLSNNNQGNILKALEYYEQSLKLRQEINDKTGIALAYNNFAFIYNNQGNIGKALEYYNKSLKLQEEAGNKTGAALTLNNIGAIYHLQDDILKALDCYDQSIKIYEQAGDKRGVATCLINIGGIKLVQKDAVQGLACFTKALKLEEEIGDKQGIAQVLNNIAFVNEREGNIDKALENYKRSLKLRQEIGDRTGIAGSLVNMSVLYFREKNTIWPWLLAIRL